MNEEELKALADKVEGETLVDPQIELDWVNEILQTSITNEQRWISAFRLHRFTRNDSEMQRAAGELDKVRSTLKYLQGRKVELEAQLKG